MARQKTSNGNGQPLGRPLTFLGVHIVDKLHSSPIVGALHLLVHGGTQQLSKTRIASAIALVVPLRSAIIATVIPHNVFGRQQRKVVARVHRYIRRLHVQLRIVVHLQVHESRHVILVAEGIARAVQRGRQAAVRTLQPTPFVNPTKTLKNNHLRQIRRKQLRRGIARVPVRDERIGGLVREEGTEAAVPQEEVVQHVREERVVLEGDADVPGDRGQVRQVVGFVLQHCNRRREGYGQSGAIDRSQV